MPVTTPQYRTNRRPRSLRVLPPCGIVTLLFGCGARDDLWWDAAIDGAVAAGTSASSTTSSGGSHGGTTVHANNVTGGTHANTTGGNGGTHSVVTATFTTGGRTQGHALASGGKGGTFSSVRGGSGGTAGSVAFGGWGSTSATTSSGKGGAAGTFAATRSGTGATGATAGAAGSTGVPESFFKLIGDYDVRLDLTAPSGCETLPSAAHVNLSIAPNAVTFIHVSTALDWKMPNVDSFRADGSSFVIDRGDAANDQLVSELRLDFNEEGLTGTGAADMWFLCGTEERLVTVPAVVGPDVTPPQLRAFGTMPGGVIFPFDLVLFEFSEIIVPATKWSAAVRTFAEPDNSVRLVDPASRQQLDYYWTTWPWGPPTVVGFSDRTQMNGRAFALEMLQNFADHAKHSAVVARNSFDVLDVGLPTTVIDFDDGGRTGAFGRFSYIMAGSPDSPCESGGCLGFDYTTPRCIGDAELEPATPTGFAVRLASTGTSGVKVRYRILSTEPYTPNIVIFEVPGLRDPLIFLRRIWNFRWGELLRET